jgi:hypothetical protein
VTTTLQALLDAGPIAINLGLRGFAESLKNQGAPVVHVTWEPPAEIDADLASLLDTLI